MAETDEINDHRNNLYSSYKQNQDEHNPSKSNSSTTIDKETKHVYKTELFIDLKPTTVVNNSEYKPHCDKCKHFINCNNESEIKFNNRSYHMHCFTCVICGNNLNNAIDNKFQIDDKGQAVCAKCEYTQANKCFVCQKAILREESIILDNNHYHKKCFSCFKCQNSLVNERNYRIHNLKLCCYQCYSEYYAQRCQRCSKAISNGLSTGYNGKKYHPDCFQCQKCNKIIIDSKFAIHQDQICCMECYNEYFTEKCFQCLKSLANQESIVYNNKTYHLDCFQCQKCNKTIDELEFPTHNSKPYCIECYNDNFAIKCYKCLKAILTGKSIIYNENKYHLDCFRCFHCNNILSELKFHMEKSNPCCITCYNEYFAAKCIQCSKLITSGRSIIFDKQTYHPDCFRCFKCNNTMTDYQCRIENGKPCCIQCYDQFFKPRCLKCSKPIVDKYTMFEGKKIHIECFVCIKCHRIISNKENFYHHQTGILCSSCIS